MAQFILLVKASKASESGQMPTEAELTEMGAYNETLVDAGVLVAGEGLHPSSNGARVCFDGDSRTVTTGPFENPEQLVAGYWVLEVASRDDAIEWARKVPFREGEIEVRQIFTAEDFGDAATPEVLEHEQQLRDRIAQQRG